MATTLTSSYQLICSKSTSTYSTLRLYGKLNSQDTTNNTSSISLQARLYGNGGSGSFSSGSIKITATSGSSTTNLGSTSYSKGSEKTLKTWTTTVSHASDGSYTNKSVSAVLTSTATPNGTASGTITIKTIPRQNTITVPDQANIGSNINIVIGNNSSSFRNTVTWSCNGLSGTVVATNGTTLDKVASGTYTWQVPTSIFATIPNGKSATVSFVNKTYSGTTQIGTNTTDSLIANVPTSSNPTLTLVSKVETTQAVKDAIPSSATDFTKPIINLSKPKFTFTARANDSATLVSLSIVNGNNTRNVSLSGTTQTVEYTFQNPMTNPVITFNVTDSRGSTMTTPYVFDGTSQQFVYTNPIFKTVVIKRPNITQSTVRAEITGIYTPKELNGSTNNKIWVGFDSMEVGGQYSGNIEWYESGVSSNITLDTTNGTWAFNGNLVNKTAAYNKSYYFKVYVKDNVTGQQEFVYMLAKSVPTMSLGENDMQVNGELYLADNNSNNKIRVGHIVNGQRMLMCSGTQGTSGVYIKLCHISLASHDQGRFNNFKIFIGDGNNGRVDQQAYIDLTLQQGYTGSVGGRFGGTWELHPMKTGFKLSNTNILVISSTNLEYDVWFYTTRTYCRPSYIYNVDEGTTITHIGNVTQTTAPSGTLCNVEGVVESVPVVLYNDTSGTNGTVTLSSSAANYTYLEIFYRGNDSQYSSVKVFEPNGKNVSMLVSLTYNNQIYFKQKIVTISGTSITNANNSQGNFNASQQGWSNVNYIYITRVLGYY